MILNPLDLFGMTCNTLNNFNNRRLAGSEEQPSLQKSEKRMVDISFASISIPRSSLNKYCMTKTRASNCFSCSSFITLQPTQTFCLFIHVVILSRVFQGSLNWPLFLYGFPGQHNLTRISSFFIYCARHNGIQLDNW